MKKRLARLFFIFTAVFAFVAFSQQCFAQMGDDTTNNGTRGVTKLGLPPSDPANGAPRLLGAPTTTDTINMDSLKLQPFQPNPKKAGMYSAILPGLGQLYNRQYWKVAVVYAGVGAATYFIISNLNQYEAYRKAYIGRINNPYPTDPYVIRTNGVITGYIYTEDQLQQLQNDYDKYLDLTVLFTGIGFALQVVDAITSAHLKNFDVSRDISLKISPVIFPAGAGLALVMCFK